MDVEKIEPHAVRAKRKGGRKFALSAAQVLQVRARRASAVRHPTIRELAIEFGVSDTTIQKVLRGDYEA